MKFHVVPYESIIVPTNRQRRFFDEEKIQELAASIMDNGLIQPIVVRDGPGDDELILVAGERRLRALDIVWGYGEKVFCNNHEIPEKGVPCVYLGEVNETDAYEIELEENIRRTDLDWKEKAVATARLYDLRRLQSASNGDPAPTITTISEEISGTGEGQFRENIRQDIILARNLDNPVVAGATSRKEAFKALKRHEETKRNEELGLSIGATFNASVHKLLQGDCLEVMPSLPSGHFDVILTDPPYGMGADEFGDSDGKTAGAHRYRDSYETWKALFGAALVGELNRVAKPAAHLYMFCDIDRFAELKAMLSYTWKVFRTPLIWINPTAMRAPWPEHGPQRKWQMILYAIRGDKPVTRLYSDVLHYPSDPNLGHQAQKPVALLVDLLRRSIRPGDSILDPFAGTGSIYPACHELQCKATGIEVDPAAAGIAAKRLGDLK